MGKTEFLKALSARLEGLDPKEREKPLNYYAEMIDERMDDGMSEEEAVAALGSLEDITASIIMETPLPALVKAKLRQKRTMASWEILLLVLGFPLWFPLLMTAIGLLIALVAAAFSVVVSLAALALTLVVGGLAGAVWAITQAAQVNILSTVGAGLMFAGFGLLVALLLSALSKGIWQLLRGLMQSLKKRMVARRQNP